MLAPAAGTVTYLLDGRPDQAIGSADGHYQSGNNIVIDIGGGRYLLIAHLTPGSIQVKVGDHVEPGQQIAKVGNSGNTIEPHLHIQAQTIGTSNGDVATMDIVTTIRTLHTRPLVFTDVVLTRRGEESTPRQCRSTAWRSGPKRTLSPPKSSGFDKRRPELVEGLSPHIPRLAQPS